MINNFKTKLLLTLIATSIHSDDLMNPTTYSKDLYTEVINWEEIRYLKLAFFKSGVPHIDTPQDHAFFATMYKSQNIMFLYH